MAQTLSGKMDTVCGLMYGVVTIVDRILSRRIENLPISSPLKL